MPKKRNRIPKKPYKEAEFEAFLETLSDSTVAYWVQVAQVLGISKDTISVWKKHPKAQQAIRDGMKKNMEGMQKAGKKDWRMWESKTKMLGVAPLEKQDITSGGEKVVPILDVRKDDSNGKTTSTK